MLNKIWSSLRLKQILSRSSQSSDASQSGNIFFTLFGAVAIVGLLGTVVVSTIRGPLTTMVEVQNRTEAESQMAIASRLALLESTQAVDGGDCDGDGFVEPLEFTIGAGPTGGGLLPSSVSSTRVDPWGTDYGYCTWDAGDTIDDAGCDTDSSTTYERLDGTGDTSEDYTVIAIISAGPNQIFDSSCSAGPPAINKAGDDIIVEYTYAAAASSTGGLWSIKSDDPDTAEINKNLDVTGSASFQDGIDLSGSASAALKLGVASMLLPTQSVLLDASCPGGGANIGLMRINESTTPDTLEICNTTGFEPASSGGLWSSGAGDDIYYTATTPQVGIGKTDPDQALDVVGNIAATGNFTGVGQTLTGNATVGGTFGVTDLTTLSTLKATGAVDFDSTLNVDGSGTFRNTVDFQNHLLNTTGALNLYDDVVVQLSLDVNGATILRGTTDARGAIANSTGNINLNDHVDIANDLTVVNVTASGTVDANDFEYNNVDFTPAVCASGSFNRWTASGWACETDTAGSGGGSLSLPIDVEGETTLMEIGTGSVPVMTHDPTNGNLFFGQNSGEDITPGVPSSFSGLYNVFIGHQAGKDHTSGDSNIFIGYQAGYTNTTGSNNVFTGHLAGSSNTTGSHNMFTGYLAGSSNTTGSDNVFTGDGAGQNNTTGGSNIFVGYLAGDNNTEGTNNIIIGSNIDNLTATTDNYLSIRDSITGDMATGNIAITGTAALAVPSGTTAQRPTGVNGMIRYNSTTGKLETYEAGAWADAVGGGGGSLSLPIDVEGETTLMEIGTGSVPVMTHDPTNGNLFFGQNSGEDITPGVPSSFSGLYNVFIGHQAGKDHTSGDSNIFIGYRAGYTNTTGSNNVFTGYSAGNDNTTGGSNVFTGYQAGYTNTTGSNNVFTGYRAGQENTEGEDNVFTGNSAGSSNTTGSRNVFTGRRAGSSNTTGSSNVFTGFLAGDNNTTGGNNVFTGYQAGQQNTTGGNNVFTGHFAGYSNTTGGDNVFTGYQAGQDNTTGSENVFTGHRAGYRNTTGGENVFTGYLAGFNNTEGGSNVFTGYLAGSNNTTGDDNVFTGYLAGQQNTTGGRNVFTGFLAGYNNTEGRNNVFTGYQAGQDNTTGGRNIFTGFRAGYTNTTGDNNIFMGYSAGSSNTTGGNNLFTGYQAGLTNTTGGSNVFVGHQAGGNNTEGTNNIIIGSNTDNLTATTDNYLNIGNAITGTLDTATPFDASSITIAGDLAVTNDITYVGSIIDTSDRRLKDNIKPLNKAGSLLNRLDQIDTYSFSMKGDKTNRTEFGVMAQELETIFPDLVHTADDEIGTKSVNYIGLITPMIEATKELKAENERLKSELSALKTSHDTTLAKLETLDKNVALLNKLTGSNVNKASMAHYWFILLGLFAGLGIMFSARYIKS